MSVGVVTPMWRVLQMCSASMSTRLNAEMVSLFMTAPGWFACFVQAWCAILKCRVLGQVTKNHK